MMRFKGKDVLLFLTAACVVIFYACSSRQASAPLFQVLDSKTTGLDFTNKLTPNNQFNVLHYMYYYNGAGVAAGDFNNDGLIDLFFASNQQDNKLYLNTGKLHFRDATLEAKIPQDNGW